MEPANCCWFVTTQVLNIRLTGIYHLIIKESFFQKDVLAFMHMFSKVIFSRIVKAR